MALPNKLKNFAWFANGVSYVGQVAEIVLPDLSRKMEEVRNGGMNAPVSADMGMESMTMEITTGTAAAHYREFGQAKADAVLNRFAGAWQNETTGEVVAVEIVVRGRYQQISNGTAKAGEDAPTKLSLVIAYYKLIIDGTVEIEIDPINFIEIIGGVDRLKDQRTALGI